MEKLNINIRMLMESRVVIPRVIFSSLISFIEIGVKKPTIAISVIMDVGAIKLTK